MTTPAGKKQHLRFILAAGNKYIYVCYQQSDFFVFFYVNQKPRKSTKKWVCILYMHFSKPLKIHSNLRLQFSAGLPGQPSSPPGFIAPIEGRLVTPVSPWVRWKSPVSFACLKRCRALIFHGHSPERFFSGNFLSGVNFPFILKPPSFRPFPKG